MKHWSDILKNVSMLTQFGLSLLTPLLLCLGICWWLSNRFDLTGLIWGAGSTFRGFSLAWEGARQWPGKCTAHCCIARKKRRKKKKQRLTGIFEHKVTEYEQYF